MKNVKWILIAFVVGILAGAILIYALLYRPASARAAEFRQRAEQLDGQLANALADYTRSTDFLGERIDELEATLARERVAGAKAIARARGAEERAGDLADRLRRLTESSGGAEEIVAGIRGETNAGLEDLARLRGLLEGGR